ncbi:copper homeostasis protein CutC [Propioniferax innocua]|uniref:Copper homeostasis protein cutC homolog n=1 Tax=Propioniferax innocua TaxID=1753 RepID=A0A542ZCS5_9ACTN|nr:copper homeostasis protein CutC [Propioniferax innocua]TQL58155.1 copper homeostasis protein [Propioniferax innocua]
MSLLEVIALGSDDAVRAEAGGADRIELVGTMDHGGLAPDPRLVEETCAATDLPVRPMLRLRPGFGVAEDIDALAVLARQFRDAGAAGVVLGFLTGQMVDTATVETLVEAAELPVTFHRAIDEVADRDAAWRAIAGFAAIDQVLTAGCRTGVGDGLDALLQAARADETIAVRTMAGGGLRADHVPALLAAGVTAFHIGSPARRDASFDQPVDDANVTAWRELIAG